MRQKRLGNSDIMISAVGLGCMGLSHASGAPTEKSEAVKILRQAHEIGYTFFDTAECYTGINPDGSIHYNEEIVGDALRPIRDEVWSLPRNSEFITKKTEACFWTANRRQSADPLTEH